MQANAEATIPVLIASEIGCRPDQARAAIGLIDEGATIPFIARYRKEATGGLDDTQLRRLDERLSYLRDFAKRRESVVKAISDLGKMTEEIGERIARATTKAELDDIHAPFRTRVKTRAQTAVENGLLPLAEAILGNAGLDPETAADAFVGEKVPDRKAALDGARDILAERFASHPETPRKVRQAVKPTAVLKARVVDGRQAEGAKFADYFDHSEPLAKAPGHRVLAMLRGMEAGVLTFDVEIDETAVASAKSAIAADNGVAGRGPFLSKVVDWAGGLKFGSRMVAEMTSEARERAEAEAIDVFVKNMKALLLAAPAGMKTTMGLDPGIRTGVKVAVVDATGKLLETDTVYPFAPRNDIRGTIASLSSLVRRHGVELISIGNGTASRETDALVGQLLDNLTGNRPVKVIVNEAGASVYSASELAAREFPGLDVSLRGAVSIARRLQDPLAELVKIDPKSIGVGQYQHDVDQTRLAKALEGAVEDAVNAVGVDVNTASPALLSYVSGVGPSLAEAIVRHRDEKGVFRSRRELSSVPRLGDKAFAQRPGFLRVNGGDEPLDASAVHPEAYEVARRIVKACGRDLRQIMGDEKSLRGMNPEQFVTSEFGIPTVRDIFAELAKPGRDPRPEFRTASLKEGVNEVKDLRPGMKLEATVTNVTAFGAFVDIGVHQDGLVHISQLSDSFVDDPSNVVRAGQIVKVTVVSVDVQTKRIGLSMKSNPEIGDARGSRGQPAGERSRGRPMSASPSKDGTRGGALAEALARAMRR